MKTHLMLCILSAATISAAERPSVQGKSFTSLLDHPEKLFREVAYSRYGPGDAVISERFIDSRYRNGRSEMLYDLENDPQENINIVNDPEHADTLEKIESPASPTPNRSRQMGGTISHENH